MPYCFATHSAMAGIPQPTVLLADLPDADWGLYESAVAADGVDTHEFEPVADALHALIESGTRYPPALALAREEVHEVLAGEPASRHDFVTAYSTAVRAYLERQYESTFVLAKALTDGEHGRACGQWFWVLEVTLTPSVAVWVSDDYCLREAPASAFDLTGQQLRRLAGS